MERLLGRQLTLKPTTCFNAPTTNGRLCSAIECRMGCRAC